MLPQGHEIPSIFWALSPHYEGTSCVAELS